MPKQKPNKKLQPHTGKQIAALKYLIAHSPDASFFCKRLCFWLIDQTNGLTEPIQIELRGKRGQEIAYDVHDMGSADLSTHLDQIMACMGTDFRFMSCSTIPNKYAVKLGLRNVKVISCSPIDFKAVNAILLARPGMHPNMEEKWPEPDVKK